MNIQFVQADTIFQTVDHGWGLRSGFKLEENPKVISLNSDREEREAILNQRQLPQGALILLALRSFGIREAGLVHILHIHCNAGLSTRF